MSDIISSSAFTSHRASHSRVSEISKVVLTFSMMSETKWTAVGNVVFFSKRSIIIILPVRPTRIQKESFKNLAYDFKMTSLLKTMRTFGPSRNQTNYAPFER